MEIGNSASGSVIIISQAVSSIYDERDTWLVGTALELHRDRRQLE